MYDNQRKPFKLYCILQEFISIVHVKNKHWKTLTCVLDTLMDKNWLANEQKFIFIWVPKLYITNFNVFISCFVHYLEIKTNFITCNKWNLFMDEMYNWRVISLNFKLRNIFFWKTFMVQKTCLEMNFDHILISYYMQGLGYRHGSWVLCIC